MIVRHAAVADAEAISQLIRGVAHYCTLDPNGVGAESFMESIETAAIRQCVRDPKYQYWVAHLRSDLVGVVAIRDGSHLYHLFVAEQHHRQGVGKLLWQHARDSAVAAGSSGTFTVNSTPYAVPIYESFGFKTTGPRVETKGIASVPMQLTVAPGRDG